MLDQGRSKAPRGVPRTTPRLRARIDAEAAEQGTASAKTGCIAKSLRAVVRRFRPSRSRRVSLGSLRCLARCRVGHFSKAPVVTSRPSVVIIGGGIGGLFAANALIAQGLRVAVPEQASALGEVGAGVLVTPNAERHLERVGLGPAVER